MVSVWSADGVENAIANSKVTPPTTLCYKDNPHETFAFLDRWCGTFLKDAPEGGMKPLWINRPKNPRALARIDTYVDFSQLEFLSTAAALVMTAEYDRVATIIGSAPPAINLDKWHDGVFKKLHEIGFFENVGLLESLEDKFSTAGDVRTLKITSGKNAAELEDVCQKVMLLCEFMDVQDEVMSNKIFYLNTALGEAMINVARHAYPDDHQFERRHVGKWWITASVDRKNKILEVAIFDQGATIPITFPRKRPLVAIKDKVAAKLSGNDRFVFESDGTYIHEAMQPGMTQTNERHRGKGLPEMREIIDTIGNASMTIYSRGGVCQYGHNGFQFHSQPHPIGGTLIEWTLRFAGER